MLTILDYSKRQTCTFNWTIRCPEGCAKGKNRIN